MVVVTEGMNHMGGYVAYCIIVAVSIAGHFGVVVTWIGYLKKTKKKCSLVAGLAHEAVERI